MIKNNKLALAVASLFILAPIPAGVILWSRLPEELPIHWGFNGEADAFAPKPFAVFGVPLLMLAIFWLCLIVTSRDKKNEGQSKKVQASVIWLVPLMSCVLGVITYCAALEVEMQIHRAVLALLGAVAIVLGNYLPKCKQNRTIGIKVKWTLESEENWNRTHRFAGRLWFVCGILLAACALLPEKTAYIATAPLVAVITFLPIAYSYIIFRKTK